MAFVINSSNTRYLPTSTGIEIILDLVFNNPYVDTFTIEITCPQEGARYQFGIDTLGTTTSVITSPLTKTLHLKIIDSNTDLSLIPLKYKLKLLVVMIL